MVSMVNSNSRLIDINSNILYVKCLGLHYNIKFLENFICFCAFDGKPGEVLLTCGRFYEQKETS